MKVFISHTTSDPRDRALAHRVAECLRARNVACFIAPDSIPPGKPWEDAIETAIRGCTHFFVIYSAAAHDAEWVQKEIALARERHRSDGLFHLLALVMGDDLAHPFPDKQWVPYHDDRGKQLDAILVALGQQPPTILERVANPALFRGDALSEGDVVPLLCDRVDQEGQFASDFLINLRNHPGIPQVYFVLGEPEANHRSLLSRLQSIHVQDYAEQIHGTEGGAVPSHPIAWSRSSDAAHACEEVVAKLFGTLSPTLQYGGPPLTPERFRTLLQQRGSGVRLYVHELYASAWSKTQTAALRQYLGFWNDIAAVPLRERPVLLFFHGILDELPGRSLVTAAKQLTAAANGEPWKLRFSLLPQLECVRPRDVERWLDDRLPDCTDDDREELSRKLFANTSCEHMNEVERRLRSLHRRYVETRRLST